MCGSGRLGTVKLGETVVPIVALRFANGMLQVTAAGRGPYPADSGTVSVFDNEGRFIISNTNPTSFETVRRGATLTVAMPVAIWPSVPNPLLAAP